MRVRVWVWILRPGVRVLKGKGNPCSSLFAVPTLPLQLCTSALLQLLRRFSFALQLCCNCSAASALHFSFAATAPPLQLCTSALPQLLRHCNCSTASALLPLLRHFGFAATAPVFMLCCSALLLPVLHHFSTENRRLLNQCWKPGVHKIFAGVDEFKSGITNCYIWIML